MPPKQCVAFVFCVNYIQLWTIAECTLPSQAKLVIMPTNIRPAIIENNDSSRIVGFLRCRELLQCHRVPPPNSKAMFHETNSLTQRLNRHRLKTTVSFSKSWVGTCSLSFRYQVGLIRRIGCCASAHNPITYVSLVQAVWNFAPNTAVSLPCSV